MEQRRVARVGETAYPVKTRRPAASSSTTATCENPGRPYREPNLVSPWWETSSLTTTTPWPEPAPMKRLGSFHSRSNTLISGVGSLTTNPPTKANRVRFPAGSLQDFHMWKIVPDNDASMRDILRITRFSRPCIPALLYTHLASPSSALNTSMLRVAQISSLTRDVCEVQISMERFNLTCGQESLQIGTQFYCGLLTGNSVPELYNLFTDGPTMEWVGFCELGKRASFHTPIYLGIKAVQDKGAAVAERRARSPPTKANRAQSPARSPDSRKWEPCRTMNVGRRIFSGTSRFSHPFIPAPLHIHFSHPHRLSRPRC
ncbi:hypothetical protein PR048_021287 [Dryococelus australis]|uniref:Uncharacterized protein n=1 Tax=Dryococelus australis TaxID=614101 RepID=A0ABQ9GXS2_9NEOP|nr:hypothetical protein PR048_021287 [Dryococelus australis]